MGGTYPVLLNCLFVCVFCYFSLILFTCLFVCVCLLVFVVVFFCLSVLY